MSLTDRDVVFISSKVTLMSVVIRLSIHQPLNGLFKADGVPPSPPPPPASRQTKLSSARQLLDVLNQSPSRGFSAGRRCHCKKGEAFWQRGCVERWGIKWGSESTVGQSASALSGLSISLTPTNTPTTTTTTAKTLLSLTLSCIKEAVYLSGNSLVHRQRYLSLSPTWWG